MVLQVLFSWQIPEAKRSPLPPWGRFQQNSVVSPDLEAPCGLMCAILRHWPHCWAETHLSLEHWDVVATHAHHVRGLTLATLGKVPTKFGGFP